MENPGKGEMRSILNNMMGGGDDKFSKDDYIPLAAAMLAIKEGITPEVFNDLYEMVKPLLAFSEIREEKDSRSEIKEGMPNGSDITLILKIQMKGVAKPPMWRSVAIGADATFEDLHDVIQTVVGLDNYHLWEFYRKEHNSIIRISLPSDDDFGVQLTHSVDTPIGAFLSDVGDKMEYVYDFGDDWIFTVTVKKIEEAPCSIPRCIDYKGEMNAIEDIGGTWSYLDLRNIFSKWENMSKKEKKQAAIELGYEDAQTLEDLFAYAEFNLDDVNAELNDWFG